MGEGMEKQDHHPTPRATFQKIVFTGGPCGGKSTAQSVLSDALENAGWRVFKMSEVATFVLSGGVVFSRLSAEEAFQFQANMLCSIMTLEKQYVDLGRSMASRESCNVALLCDRGTLDTSVFLESREQWLQILASLGTNEIELRDQSYDLVIHMASAANGAEQFYSNETNVVRSEGLSLARDIDDKLKLAWMGHPYFYLVDNSTGFEEKLQRVVSTVLSHLGIPDRRSGSLTYKLKFKIPRFPPDDLEGVPYRDFVVHHNYLITGDDQVQSRIRKRGIDGSFAYTLTIRRERSGQRIEVRRSLSSREYEALQAQIDPSRHTVIKQRRCFVWNNCYYQIDNYQSPIKDLVLLEVFVTTKNDDKGEDGDDDGEDRNSFIPPFIAALGKCQDVTGDPTFSMFNLSKEN